MKIIFFVFSSQMKAMEPLISEREKIKSLYMISNWCTTDKLIVKKAYRALVNWEIWTLRTTRHVSSYPR